MERARSRVGSREGILGEDGFNGGKDGRAWIGGVGEGGGSLLDQVGWMEGFGSTAIGSGTVFLMRYSLKVLLTCSIVLA